MLRVSLVIEQDRRVLTAGQLALPVGDGHGVASGRVDEVVVALGAEVKACVAATPWVSDDRFSAGVNDNRPDIVLVVRLGVVTALGGQYKRIRIAWINPPDHPVLATKPIVHGRCPLA